MKIAIYLRVSTDKQDLENQIEPLLNFANSKGYSIFKIYRDVATGKNKERIEFKKMLEDAGDRKFNAILVWALDRLSREGMHQTVNLLEHLNNVGVDVISYTEPYLNTTNELSKNILLAVVSTLAKAEREKISERTKAGLNRLKKKGVKLGRPKLKEEVKKEIFRLNEEKKGVREISRQLKISPAFISIFLKENKK